MTIGIGDVTPDMKLIDSNQLLIDESYGSCDTDISLYDNNQLEAKPGMSVD